VNYFCEKQTEKLSLRGMITKISNIRLDYNYVGTPMRAFTGKDNFLLARECKSVYIRSPNSESSSVGRARPCQGRGREFESRLSLKSLPSKKGFVFTGLNTCSDGGTGRHAGLKILFP
jgi:hypothetical protein